MKNLESKPTPPASNECCGSGSCCPCVWDDYRAKLKIWQEENGEEQATEAKKQKEPEKDKHGRVWPTFR